VDIDDDRALAVTRDPHGAFVVELAKRSSASITPASVISSATIARLEGCPAVRVYALPPLHGLSRLLPPGVAWGYSMNTSPLGATAPKRVVISDTLPPVALDLARLGSWGPPPEGATWLHGEAATPTAVLSQIGDATEIEMHAHGVVDAAESSAAIIALSPDRSGRYALTASDLRPGSLRGHPVVVLGACHAAKTAAYFHEAWSLPTAFVRAGARSVFASPSEIRDAEARSFFDAVLARIRQGAPPAVALRDERVSWLARDPQSWVVDVIDFE
jgi:CHAT domain-containing protein